MERAANLLKEIILTKEDILSEAKKIGIDKLPFGYRSISSFIDGKTMDIHYNKHYKGYVDKLNKALSKKNYGDVELENIIKSISKYNKTIRNNAGGAFNHALFWKMLSPKKQEIPTEIKNKIIKDFGSINTFKKEFTEIAKDRFGSGWCWLILTKNNRLKIMSTPNQDNPLMNIVDGGGFPILGLDVWEHAYYLKYQNKSDEYIENFWDVVNWEFVNKLYTDKKKTKLTESVKTKKLIKEEVEVLNPNGRLNPIFVQTILKKVYPKCSPEIIRDYNPDTRIESPCYGKIQTELCKTNYGVIGGKYAVSQRGGTGEWSVVNWFDANTRISDKILEFYEKYNSKNYDLETWFNIMGKTLFGDEGKFTNSLANIVLNPKTKKGTLDRGIEREKIAIEIFNTKNKNSQITQFCDGDTRDKYKGQDMFVTEDGVSKYVQVKPTTDLYETRDKQGNTIYIFKSKNVYNTNNIQIFAFVDDKNNYIFFDFNEVDIEDGGTQSKERYSYVFNSKNKKFQSQFLKLKKINITENMNSTIIITKEQAQIMNFLISEDIKINNNQLDINSIIKRELQKLRPIPTEMNAAKEAINNIVTAEISRGKLNFSRTIDSLFNLNLSTVSDRNKYRFNNYYYRFYRSRTRGLDFEGLISGLIDGDISEDINSPYDLITKDGKKISIKIVRNLSESPVLKSAKGNIQSFIENYNGSDENKQMLITQAKNENLLSFLISSGNNDYINIAEDLVDFILPDIDGLLIGVPNENFNIDLFYFDREGIKSLALEPGNLGAPKTKGSQQIRFKKSVFQKTPSEGNRLVGKIYFPIISEQEYIDFLVGNEKTKETLSLLNRFGSKYNIRNLGGNIPQDIIHSLSDNENFKQDILNLLD
jgi:Fe-Mn family superoxide dismutase